MSRNRRSRTAKHDFTSSEHKISSDLNIVETLKFRGSVEEVNMIHTGTIKDTSDSGSSSNSSYNSTEASSKSSQLDPQRYSEQSSDLTRSKPSQLLVSSNSSLIQEIVCNVRDAVVTISGQAIFLGELICITQGNGFFIKGHYIICTAGLVLIPPTLLNNNNRIPNNQLTYPNDFVRMSKILVTISNVNGCGKSYSYEADIVGVDGAANIAILYINSARRWNICNPPIRSCHPFLNWGKSRNNCPGDTVILIGEISGLDRIGLTRIPLNGVAENGVSIGNIADNRYVSYGGSVPGELLLLSNIIPTGLQTGLPVITTSGTVVGMYLHIEATTGLNIALSEFFMRRPVKALIRSFIDGSVPENYHNFVEPVSDPINSYYRFNKAWLGLGGILMSQNDYDTTINNDLSRNPIILGSDVTDGPSCKEIVGYRILAVASPIVPSNSDFFVPGATPPDSLVPTLPPSPVYGLIFVGDIITHINSCPLGDRKGQISPALLMWRVCPGNTIIIRYRKQMENFEGFHELTVCAGSYEPFLDFPWYTTPIPETLETMLPVLI